MTDQAQGYLILAPFQESRFWLILLWVMAVSGGLALLDTSERQLTLASNQPIMMLSRQPGDAEQRAALKRDIITQPGIADARWRTPEELTTSVSGRFPQGQWADLFPDDVAWLPWMLEVYPANSMGNADTIRGLIDRWRNQTDIWSVVLWDGQTVERLTTRRRMIRLTLGFWILLTSLCGVAGLMRQPWPERGGKTLVAWTGVLGTLAPVAIWVVAMQSGGQADSEVLIVAVLTGFVMTVVIAPLLRIRRRHQKSWIVSEDTHER